MGCDTSKIVDGISGGGFNPLHHKIEDTAVDGVSNGPPVLLSVTPSPAQKAMMVNNSSLAPGDHIHKKTKLITDGKSSMANGKSSGESETQVDASSSNTNNSNGKMATQRDHHKSHPLPGKQNIITVEPSSSSTALAAAATPRSREQESLLEQYKECEERICMLERDDPLTMYYIKKGQLLNIMSGMELAKEKIKLLTTTATTATATIAAEEEEMQRGRNSQSSGKSSSRSNGTGNKNRKGPKNNGGGEGQNLRKVVVDYGTRDIVSQAEQEYLTCLNRRDIAATELEMLQQEKVLLESEASNFKTICVKLVSLYERQDDVAKRLTDGSNNSTPEEEKGYKLLAEVEKKKIRISEALQRWREARSQVTDACRQFSTALRKWREIKDDKPSRLYDCAEEVRDDLVTSMQCINNTRFYIKFELPYCSKMEMGVLEKALSYIFIDMNTAERRLHADTCYKAFHNRAVALFAWIDKTIKKVIEPESRRVSDELSKASKLVRQARFSTIHKQFPHVVWKVNDIGENANEETDRDTANGNLTDTESLQMLKKLDSRQLIKPPNMEEIYGKSTTKDGSKIMLIQSISPDTSSNPTPAPPMSVSVATVPTGESANKVKNSHHHPHHNGTVLHPPPMVK